MINNDVCDWRCIEGVWLTHPLRHEPLPTGLRKDPVVSRALVLLPRRHDHPLAMQRVIRILNDDCLDMTMGRMRYRRSAARNRC
jgi:hypothetical protein